MTPACWNTALASRHPAWGSVPAGEVRAAQACASWHLPHADVQSRCRARGDWPEALYLICPQKFFSQIFRAGPSGEDNVTGAQVTTTCENERHAAQI